MTDAKIVLVVNGKRAEMTLAEAREMLRQLKAVFGETALPVASPTNVPDPAPWLPKVWCGTGAGQPFWTVPGHGEYGGLVRN